MNGRLPGWVREILGERDSDVRVPPSCAYLVRPLELAELVPYQQGPRAHAVVMGPGFAWHRELGHSLSAEIAGEVGHAV